MAHTLLPEVSPLIVMRRSVLGLVLWPTHLLSKVSPLVVMRRFVLGLVSWPTHLIALGVSVCHEAVTSSFIGDVSSDSKILYHHVDLGEITATDHIERESCGALFAILRLIFYVWSFYAFLLDSSTHTNSLWCLRLSSAVAPP